jgi:hypothetical protein
MATPAKMVNEAIAGITAIFKIVSYWDSLTVA